MTSSFESPRPERTAVAIIGGGVAGLTLATFLHGSGVACVVLERRDRAYVELRQRAGVVEAHGVGMFERWGLADKLLGGDVAQTIDYRVDGASRVFEITGEPGSPSRFCTQQMLVNNLLRELIDEAGGDVRFGVDGVAIEDDGDRRPRVRYRDASGAHEIECDHVVGCDGDRGVTRQSILPGVLTSHVHEFGYAWLAALVDAPLVGHPVMGVSDHGFVAQLPRGPNRSRFYLQCALGDGPEDWPDARIWDEIRLRLHDHAIVDAPVLDRDFVPLRSVVHVPMQHRNLFLAGDAAHLVPPTGAKGMNLALRDVDLLAQALVRAVRADDRTALDSYSDNALRHVWRYQEFSVWMTDTMHEAGDTAPDGAFRRQIARTRLDTLFGSETAARLHSGYLVGAV